jgi:hypothetical protein
MVVLFSLIKEGEILGNVIGDSNAYFKLAEISNLNGPSLQLRSNVHASESEEFRSDDVLLLSGRILPDDKMMGIVGELDFGNLEIVDHWENLLSIWPRRYVGGRYSL